MDDWLARAVERLQELPEVTVRARTRGRSTSTAETIEVILPGRPAVALRTRFALADQVAVGSKGRRARSELVVVNHLAREQLAAFAQAGVNVVDLAGNCSIRAAGVVLHVEGRAPARRRASDKSMRTAGWWAVLALLARPALAAAPVRELATAAGISHQAAHDVLRRLADDGALVKTDVRYAWLQHHWRRYVDRWVTGYQTYVRPKLFIDRYQAKGSVGEIERRIETQLPDGSWRWGGESVARRFAPHVEPRAAVVHVQPGASFAALRAQRVREGGNLLVLRLPERPAALDSGRPDAVHPLVAYAEMLVETDERGREAAGELLDKLRAEVMT
jgi:hypothetical protein